MPLSLVAGMMMVVLVLGYRFYGRWVARQYTLNDQRKTPAHRLQDGIDYVPTKPFYLLGQHFSAIAAAGPIAGPILAAQQFGWLPCLLWIGLGVIFIGAVHDFSSLVTSIRHDARSVAEVIRENMGEKAWIAMLGFIWLCLVYVIVAFADITASTFTGLVEELNGVPVHFERGGAVAASSTLYLLLAIVMGLVQKKWNPPLWILTLIFVPATLAAVWAGTQISTWLILPEKMWVVLILAYCFIASLLPMWLLLQPRGYLGGFVLYLVLAIGTVGVFFGGYEIQQEAFITWKAPGATGSLFPFLFVTIACGACSGFHGLVCSGTTSKQIAKESHCKPVGFGGMLLEAFVAVIAMATLMIMAKGDVSGSPGTIYGAGIGKFLTLLIGEKNLLFAVTFGAMAFSTFVFDTLDVATRLGRYILQELFGKKGVAWAALATAATVGMPALILLTTEKGAWSPFWVLFGTSNQLLAALTLLGVTVWLMRQKKPCRFTLIPMIFVMAITFSSLAGLIGQVVAEWRGSVADSYTSGSLANAIAALLLSALAIYIITQAFKTFRKDRAAG